MILSDYDEILKSPLMKDGKVYRKKGFTKKELKYLRENENKLPELLKVLNQQREFSEDFIREFRDYLNIGEVFIWQDVSKEFMREYITNADEAMYAIVGNNNNMSKKFEEEIRKQYGK